MIVSWYRQNANDFGVVRATRLLTQVMWRRAVVKSCNALLTARVECPCCGWEGNRFLDYVEAGYTIRNAECPQCGSHSRHRALFIWLNNQYRIQEKSGTALIFAPEKALASLWTTAVDLQPVKIDIHLSRGVDVLADIGHLPFAAEVANLVWCHHVLEQVIDDRLAMSELRRVLSQDGQLIISAGLSGEPTTHEFGYSKKTLSGNRRSYGDDFSTRLVEAGFVVKALSYNLTDEERSKFAVDEAPFYLCTQI